VFIKKYKKGRFEKKVKFQLLGNLSWSSFYIYERNILCVYIYIYTNRMDFFLSFFTVQSAAKHANLETLHQMD